MISLRARVALLLLVLLSVDTATAQAQEHSDICYFGDSITEGWMNAELRPAYAFPALTDSLLRSMRKTFTSINLGRGGETTDDAVRRIDSEVLRLRPRIVVLGFGSNDGFVWGNPPFQRVPVERYVLNIEFMLQKIRGIGAIPVLLGLPPVIAGRFYSLFDSSLYAPYGGVEQSNRRYTEAARVLAEKRGAAFITCSWDAGLDSLLGFDGVHPLPAGHLRVATDLAPQLAAMLDSAIAPVTSSAVSIYPVPFQRFTHTYLTFAIAVKSASAVTVCIHDSGGREVRKFVYFAWSEGSHYLRWDGTTSNGTPASNGAYTVTVLDGQNLSHHPLLIL